MSLDVKSMGFFPTLALTEGQRAAKVEGETMVSVTPLSPNGQLRAQPQWSPQLGIMINTGCSLFAIISSKHSQYGQHMS